MHDMANNTDPNSVRKQLTIDAPREIAWAVFTERVGEWWPLAMYKIGKANAIDAIIEPRVGGRWYERAASTKQLENAAASSTAITLLCGRLSRGGGSRTYFTRRAVDAVPVRDPISG